MNFESSVVYFDQPSRSLVEIIFSVLKWKMTFCPWVGQLLGVDQLLGVNQCLRVASNAGWPLFMSVFLFFPLSYFFSFFFFHLRWKRQKFVLMLKKMIWTSERCAPFDGQNTQQSSKLVLQNWIFEIFYIILHKMLYLIGSPRWSLLVEGCKKFCIRVFTLHALSSFKDPGFRHSIQHNNLSRVLKIRTPSPNTGMHQNSRVSIHFM